MNKEFYDFEVFKEEDYKLAQKEIARLCLPRETVKMSIPPRRDDTDMIFSRIIIRAKMLEAHYNATKKIEE